ncbi:hypothetical protein LCGC14_2760270, partial [marine sediment metagenome]
YGSFSVDDANDEFLFGLQDANLTGHAFKLSDAAGASEFRIRDSTGALVAKIDSNGLLTVPDIIGSAASSALKLNPTAAGDVTLFEDTDVADGADGKSFYIHRKAAEGDTSWRFYITSFKEAFLTASGLGIVTATGILRLESNSEVLIQSFANSSVSFYSAASAGENPKVSIGGYITAATAVKDAYLQVDDANDEFLFGLEDANLTGFGFKLSDAAGGSAWRLRKSTGAIAASIDSAGGGYFAGDVGIGTASPNASLEVKGEKPAGNVGGHQSGMLHVTGDGTVEFSNSVITGHSAYGGNTQLWYLGSASVENNDIAFINRENAPIHFHTNNAPRVTIDAIGNVGFGTIFPTAAIQMGNDKLIALDTNAGLTASTTQSQGQGALTAQINEVDTCANDGDTVTLPTAVAGTAIEIINNGAET